jgi:hypothetical protein
MWIFSLVEILITDEPETLWELIQSSDAFLIADLASELG